MTPRFYARFIGSMPCSGRIVGSRRAWYAEMLPQDADHLWQLRFWQLVE